MRIFIHNVDGYVGRSLVKELRRGDGGLNRIFGTAMAVENAPSTVKRIVARSDPKRAKKMAETIQSCKLVILDLQSCTEEDLHFAITALKVDFKASPVKSLGELEQDVTFILISSIMVWANTEATSEDGFLQDADYQRRRPVPGSKYEKWKELEDLVLTSFNREGSQVKGFIVAGGVLYGDGEATFCQMFKDAWRGDHQHAILAPGTNRIPTAHVRDLGRLVKQLSLSMDGINPLEANPYFLAVDQPPGNPEEKRRPSTQAQLVQSIIDEVCDKFTVPLVHELQGEDEVRETMSLNLLIEPSAMMLDPAFSERSDPPGWWCKDGLVANVRMIADEFCAERKLRAMRVLISGPPASGKSTLARAVSEHFKIPHLGLEVEMLDATVAKLSANVCRYRGYVLDAGETGFEEAEQLFRIDVEIPPAESEAPQDPPEGEDAEPPSKQYTRRLNEEICPSYVVVTQAPEPFCRARARGNASFESRMTQYVTANMTDSVHSLVDFFQVVANIGVLNLPVAGKDEEDLFESVRIYMESAGRPFNYLPSAEEVAADIRERRKARLDAELKEQQEIFVRKTSKADDDGERRMHMERLLVVEEFEVAQRHLQDLPLRDYLMRYMVPTLTEGLIEVCKVLPENPVDYLATYLEQNAAKAAEQLSQM